MLYSSNAHASTYKKLCFPTQKVSWVKSMGILMLSHAWLMIGSCHVICGLVSRHIWTDHQGKNSFLSLQKSHGLSLWVWDCLSHDWLMTVSCHVICGWSTNKKLSIPTLKVSWVMSMGILMLSHDWLMTVSHVNPMEILHRLYPWSLLSHAHRLNPWYETLISQLLFFLLSIPSNHRILFTFLF